MIIYVCERCKSQEEHKHGGGIPESWNDFGLCEKCAEGYRQVRDDLKEFTSHALRSYIQRKQQPECKKLW